MEQENKKMDRRVKRTKSAIHEAFQSLLMEKMYSEISVKELTEKADITRKTFYLHYGTLDDVLREYLSELVSEVRAEIAATNGDEEKRKQSPEQSQFDYLELFTCMSRKFNQEQKNLRKLMEDENSRQILHHILMEQQKRMWEFYQRQYGLKSEVARLYGIFTTYGFNAIYMAWYSDPDLISVDELGEMTQDIAECLRDLPEKWRQSV